MDIKITFAHYGEYRELNPTDGEAAIFEHIKALCPSCEMVRKTDAYLTAEAFGTDVARFKYTDRAKWVRFPYVGDGKKLYIEKIDDLSALNDDIVKSYEKAEKIGGK